MASSLNDKNVTAISLVSSPKIAFSNYRLVLLRPKIISTSKIVDGGLNFVQKTGPDWKSEIEKGEIVATEEAGSADSIDDEEIQCNGHDSSIDDDTSTETI